MSLNTQMLAAHKTGDHTALVTLYAKASDSAQTRSEQAFYLTHAYVFALETGHCDAPNLRARLVALGCESAD